MVYFTESYVGGFFGFGRTYGAVARFVCDSPRGLAMEWPTALAETARWRARRKERATALHLDFQAPAEWAWEAVEFVKEKVMTPPASLAPELRGLFLCVQVCTPDMEHYRTRSCSLRPRRRGSRSISSITLTAVPWPALLPEGLP